MSPSGGSNGGLAKAKPAGRSVGARCARGQPPPHKGGGEASPENGGGDADGEAPHSAASTRRRDEAERICPPLAGSSRWSHGGGGRVMEGEAPSRNEQRERNAARAARLRGDTTRGRGVLGCMGDSIGGGRGRRVAANAGKPREHAGDVMPRCRIAGGGASPYVSGGMGGTPWPRLEDWGQRPAAFP